MGAQSSVEPHDGGYWVVGTRVSLDSTVDAVREGHTAERLAQSFPVLTLAQVDGAMAYDLANRQGIDASLRQPEADVAQRAQDLSQRNPLCSQKLADSRRRRQKTPA